MTSPLYMRTSYCFWGTLVELLIKERVIKKFTYEFIKFQIKSIDTKYPFLAFITCRFNLINVDAEQETKKSFNLEALETSNDAVITLTNLY